MYQAPHRKAKSEELMEQPTTEWQRWGQDSFKMNLPAPGKPASEAGSADVRHIRALRQVPLPNFSRLQTVTAKGDDG